MAGVAWLVQAWQDVAQKGTTGMNEIYQWKENSFQYIGDAQEIGEHLAALAEMKGGGLTTDEIVADALDPSSPLHPNIEKNEQVAAHNWRKQQMRSLMGALVTVTVEKTDTIERDIRVRGFPNVEGLYRPVDVVINDTQLADAYKKILAKDLGIMRQRMLNFNEFSGVVKAIDELPLLQIGEIDGRENSTNQ